MEGNMETLYYSTYESPVGELMLVANDKGLSGLFFGRDRKKLSASVKFEEDAKHPMLQKAVKQLTEYFAGKRREFDLPLAPMGTVFQQKAWKQLCKIPYGQTISYGEQAKRLGDAKKARAVGMANNRNPIGIIVPCHRVVGASGSLVGFGGGLKAKEFLLNLEKKHAA
jgi:methylated-DNA-[protein]-cysteine S-methyltransferase